MDDSPHQSSPEQAYIQCESVFEQFEKYVLQKRQDLGMHVGLAHQLHLR